MTINTTSPTGFTSSVLIGDTQAVSGGSVDGVPSFPTANSSAVSAALAVVSTTGGVLMPTMTTTQRTALNAASGLMVYDTSLNAMYIYVNGTWKSVNVT